MIKITLILMSLSLSQILVASEGDLATEITKAVSKSQGKCRIASIETEFISILCATKSKDYSSFKITVDDNLISGTGMTWSQDAEEVECSVNGQIKADDKIKLSIRCR